MNLKLPLSLLVLFSARVWSSPVCSRVHTIGTGSAVLTSGRAGPCTVVSVGTEANDCSDEIYIFDMGQGSLRSFIDAGLDIHKVKAVFASHVHQDHVQEMGTLEFFHWFHASEEAMQNYTGLEFYCPSGSMESDPSTLDTTTCDWLRKGLEPFAVDVALRGMGGGPYMNVKEYRSEFGEAPQLILDNPLVKVHAIRVTHFPYTSDAYRVDVEGAGSFILSQDVNNDGNKYLLKLGELGPIDLLVEEITYNNLKSLEVDPGDTIHTTPHVVADTAQKLNATELMITHMIPPPCRDDLGPYTYPFAYFSEDDMHFILEKLGVPGRITVSRDHTYIQFPGNTRVQGPNVDIFCVPKPADYVPWRQLYGDSSSADHLKAFSFASVLVVLFSLVKV